MLKTYEIVGKMEKRTVKTLYKIVKEKNLKKLVVPRQNQ